MSRRAIRDRDYLETEEGLLFCAVGNVHPDDRAISYLKYMPDPSGKWGSSTHYRRVLTHYTVPSLMNTLEILKSGYPQYVFESHVYRISMSAVPLRCVERRYYPEERLKALLEEDRLDPLERKAVELIEMISESSGEPPERFGLTGSILLGIHRVEFSDLDVLVYSRPASLSVKRALLEMYGDGTVIDRLAGNVLKEWCESKTRLYPLTFNEASEIYGRKWNRGIYKDVLFSVHPVMVEEEVKERYGDLLYYPEGLVNFTAEVTDTSEALFLPSRYGVENVNVEHGKDVEDLTEVVSYEGLYSGVAEPGESIRVFGKLELVEDTRTGDEHHRVMVGSPEALGRDFIKPFSTP